MNLNTTDLTTDPVPFVEPIVKVDHKTNGDQALKAESSEPGKPILSNIKYAVLGILFGIVFVKAEIISWFRIQEMFRLESFHMYGVIGSAIVVGIISVWLIRRYNATSIEGEKIVIPDKKFNKGQIYGGIIFGLGWGITGACPGPLFAQIGTGATVILVTLLSAIAGTWVYGRFQKYFPQ